MDQLKGGRTSGITIRDLKNGIGGDLNTLYKEGMLPEGITVEERVRIRGKLVTYRARNLGFGRVDVMTAFIKK
jgi:hypothetical protein